MKYNKRKISYYCLNTRQVQEICQTSLEHAITFGTALHYVDAMIKL